MPRAVTARARTCAASLVGLVAMLGAAPSCTYPPTQVLVVVDTDFVQGRALQVTATIRRASSGEGAIRAWTRDPSGMLDGGAPITLPASFAIVPSEGEPRDDAIDLVLEARLAAGGGGEPEAVTRRHARFRFTPRQPTFVRVFLSSVCAAQASGCTSATGAACTVSQYCEDRGETCGDDGSCVNPDVMPIPTTSDAALPGVDAAMIEAAVPEASDAVHVLDSTDAVDPDAIDPPRLVWPISGSNTTTARTPDFRFVVAPGATGAFVEVCRERSCLPGYSVRVDARSSPVISRQPLAPGTWFWRATGAIDGVPGTRYSPTWQFHVSRIDAPNETAWGARLDVNGDGFDDVVMGHATVDSNRGMVAGYRGSATGLATSHDFALNGEVTDVGFGTTVASAGDVDGDGFTDLAVVAQNSTDRVRVYRGSATGVLSPPITVIPAPDAAAGSFGDAVAAAGDVNGDGYGDLAVGEPLASGGGRVFVYHGHPTGLTATPDTVLSGPGGGGFGTAIASADVNGDHFSDLLVGAPFVSGSVGRAYAFHGGPAGIGTTPSTELTGRLSTNGYFGLAVEAADMNADGFADLVTSAFGDQIGQLYTYLGSNGAGLLPMDRMTSIGSGPSMRLGETLAADGDIDRDGYGDFVAADSLSDRVLIFRGGAMDGVMTPAWADFGPPAGGSGGFGGDLAGGGDVDRDGYDDFIVVTGGQSNSQSYLFRGGTAAPTVPSVTFTPLMAGDSIASVGM